MPVSSPSYFPPNRSNGSIIGITAGGGTVAQGARDFLAGSSAGRNSTVADLIVIGDGAMAGGLTNANLKESIAIGTNALAVWTTPTGSVGTNGSMIVMGQYACAALIRGDTSIVLGQRAFSQYAGDTGAPGINQVISIGNGIGAGITTATSQVTSCVFIGSGILPTANANVANSVVIGSSAASTTNFLLRAVLIGTAAGQAVTGSDNICIGFTAGSGLTSGANNILIGATTTQSATTNSALVIGHSAGSTGLNNIVIGHSAVTPGASAGCIIIGATAGSPGTAGDHQFIIETNAGAHRAVLYGDLNAGNLIVGKSTNAVDRAFGVGPTNILKLINGTIGDATTRVGGGYFYVTAGALHYVGSGGTDTALAPA